MPPPAINTGPVKVLDNGSDMSGLSAALVAIDGVPGRSPGLWQTSLASFHESGPRAVCTEPLPARVTMPVSDWAVFLREIHVGTCASAPGCPLAVGGSRLGKLDPYAMGRSARVIRAARA